ncbi:MAG: ABC transporter ATP-binding protein [Clostridiales bacterium]|nr:ABC transporter ATP-binding protein [Clostridiales bacterium]
MKLILRYIRPFMKRIAGGMVMKFTGTVIELFLPWLLTYILTAIVPRARAEGAGIVYIWGGVMLVCSFLAMLFNILANRSAASVARDSTRDLRHDLFAKICRLTSREIDRFTTPSLISRMTTDTYYVYRMTGMMQRIGFRAPILVIGGIIITMIQDSVLSSLLLILLPFMGLGVWFISKKGIPLYNTVQNNVDKLIRIVRENLSGIRIIKALSKTEDEKKRFSGINSAVASSETKAASMMAINSPTMQFLLNMGLVLVIWVGARRVDSDLTEPARIIAFLQYFTLILNAMLTITRVITMYSKAVASANRIDEVMQGEEESSPAAACAFEQKLPHICFDHVTFSYNKRAPNVRDVSFCLMKGQKLGILGPTGAGKSTVIKLLLRLYDTDEGSISIWGNDIRNIPLDTLRDMFGVVFQNDAVFHGAAGENISLGRGLTDDEMIQGARDAQAWDFLTEKGGLDADIASRGQNLSGGQMQRMLLSRALSGHPDILILDDASSALDFKTEANLRKALTEHHADTTTILIAQRISAVMHCDQILVMDDGDVCGLGTHEELMKSCDLYREIAQLQLGGEYDAAQK